MNQRPLSTLRILVHFELENFTRFELEKFTTC